MPNTILINPFEIPPGREAEALAMWEAFAAYFRRQPGFISTQLHQALDPKAKFKLINRAEWESPEAFQAAMANPELKEIAQQHALDIPNYPGLYEIIRE